MHLRRPSAFTWRAQPDLAAPIGRPSSRPGMRRRAVCSPRWRARQSTGCDICCSGFVLCQDPPRSPPSPSPSPCGGRLHETCMIAPPVCTSMCCCRPSESGHHPSSKRLTAHPVASARSHAPPSLSAGWMQSSVALSSLHASSELLVPYLICQHYLLRRHGGATTASHPQYASLGKRESPSQLCFCLPGRLSIASAGFPPIYPFWQTYMHAIEQTPTCVGHHQGHCCV